VTVDLFTIGIGSAPNSHFMREAARLGRGTFNLYRSIAEVKEKMVALFAKLESPALTDVEIELVAGAEIVPERIPDVYLGEPITVAYERRRGPRASCCVGASASRCGNRHSRFTRPARAPGFPSLGARKDRGLLDRRRTGSAEDEIRHAVLQLALTYHLISRTRASWPSTSRRFARGTNRSHSHALKTNLPHGWDYTAVFGLGQGATYGPVHLTFGSSRSCSRPRLPPRSLARAARSIEKFETRQARPDSPRWCSPRSACGNWVTACGSTPRPSSPRPSCSGPGSGRSRGEAGLKPWPWADTWPVARLRVPVHGVDLIVLTGVSGRTPGLRSRLRTGRRVIGAPGTAIVTAHRDTHFRFLQRVRPGDEIVVELPGRSPRASGSRSWRWWMRGPRRSARTLVRPRSC